MRTNLTTLAWIDEIGECSCLWDIGANVGVFSLYAALRPQVRVIAFEPGGGNYAALNRNIELNRMSSQISAYCIALAGEDEARFSRYDQYDRGLCHARIRY